MSHFITRHIVSEKHECFLVLELVVQKMDHRFFPFNGLYEIFYEVFKKLRSKCPTNSLQKVRQEQPGIFLYEII
jgi:hypothetical protein